MEVLTSSTFIGTHGMVRRSTLLLRCVSGCLHREVATLRRAIGVDVTRGRSPQRRATGTFHLRRSRQSVDRETNETENDHGDQHCDLHVLTRQYSVEP